MTNQKFESAINFFRSNNNGNYLDVTNCLVTQIRFIFPEHKPIQLNNCDHKKLNISNVKDYNFYKSKSCNGLDISDMTRLF